MNNNNKLYWLAGFLEGEGSFLKGSPSAPRQPNVSVSSTDEDMIARAAKLMGVSYRPIKSKRYKENGWKTPYFCRLRGRRARDLMLLLRPIMGRRRQQQIDVAMACYQETYKKLRPTDIPIIRKMIADGFSNVAIGKIFKVSNQLISCIKAGRAWKNV